MLRQVVIKVAIGLALLAALLGGEAALSAHTTATQAKPAGPQLACSYIFYPPC